MTRSDLEKVIDDQGNVGPLLSLASEVEEYLDLKRVLDLGLQVHHSEIPYEKALVFSWIREGLENGREHRLPAKRH